MQNLNERGAAYIPIAEARGITPHSDNTFPLIPSIVKKKAYYNTTKWLCKTTLSCYFSPSN